MSSDRIIDIRRKKLISYSRKIILNTKLLNNTLLKIVMGGMFTSKNKSAGEDVLLHQKQSEGNVHLPT